MWIGKAKWQWLTQRMFAAETESVLQGQRYRGANEQLDRMQRDNRELRDERLKDVGQHAAAVREADLLRVRLNTLELERAALMVHLLPKLQLQVPQLGKLDVSLGAPGTDFDDLGSSDPHPDEMPLPQIRNQETIGDEVGLDGPELHKGVVVRDIKRDPSG